MSQCCKCWSLDHITDRCKGELTCRLCSGPHTESEHQSPNPAGCQRCSLAQENSDHMGTSTEGACPHELKCANCCVDPKKDHDHPADSRRCPARLERYGTARDNERHKIQTNNPWIKAKPKKWHPKRRNQHHLLHQTYQRPSRQETGMRPSLNKPTNPYHRTSPNQQAQTAILTHRNNGIREPTK